MISGILCLAIMTLHASGSDGKSLPFPGIVETTLQQFSPYDVTPVPCGFQDLEKKYYESCKKTYLDDIFEWPWPPIGVITGQEILEKISSACIHYDLYRRCANCTAKHECPEQRPMLFESLKEKWSIFCDGDQVAGWLQTMLENGFSYNKSCDFTYHNAFYTCITQGGMPEYNATAFALMSLSEGLDELRTFISALCMCTIGEVLGSSESRETCGSTWQNILLINWLKMSSLPYLGVNINEDEKKMLQYMRC